MTDPAATPAQPKPNARTGARLAVVQALYEMEISDKGVIEALAEFEAFWIGQEVDGVVHPPAEIAFFRDVLRGAVEEQRAIDPKLDTALAKGWPLRRLEAVLRAILRAGAYELMFRRDVPARAAISQYMSRSPTASMAATSRAWSTPCSTGSAARCAPPSSVSRPLPARRRRADRNGARGRGGADRALLRAAQRPRRRGPAR
ncbi:protein of unknown function [Methylorubrum extorquens]|uniref:NusB/RsmB/TIM44 domain-containing protein n=1 Tax=Methylorubrum extorquens TaxID=408 RepID=A0A2N9AP83_METEX|nr:protein of unknown function [Methylorubrum extorquens]